jgi:hypothetical protein
MLPERCLAHLAEHYCGCPSITVACWAPTISWGCRRDTRFAWWLTVREQRVPKFALHLLGLPKRCCCLRLHPSLGVAEETVASISWGCRRDIVASISWGCRRDAVVCGCPSLGVAEETVTSISWGCRRDTVAGCGHLLGLPKRFCCLL